MRRSPPSSLSPTGWLSQIKPTISPRALRHRRCSTHGRSVSKSSTTSSGRSCWSRWRWCWPHGLVVGRGGPRWAGSALLVSDWSSLNRGWSLIRSRWGKWTARLLPVIGLALLGVATHYATGSARDFHEGLLIAVAMSAVLVIAPVALDQRGPVAAALAWGPVAWLGTISYGVYLWHWPIFLVLNGERTGWSGLSLFGVRCAATLAVSIVSWWAIERPIRRWRPVRVPLLPLAGATAATAAAVTMLVVPVSARPGGGPLDGSLPPGVSSIPVVSPSPPDGRRPARAVAQRDPRRPFTVSVFGDSIGWTLMHYLPSTPGFHFVDHTVLGG